MASSNLFGNRHVTTVITTLTLMVLQCACAIATATRTRQALSRLQPDLTGSIFTDNVVFVTSSKTTSACSVKCVGRDDCRAFTFDDSTLTCQGYSTTYAFFGPATPLAGAKSWSVTTGSWPWLGIACLPNTACPAPYSECFNNKCLCIPGYYYSSCSNQCVLHCADSDLGKTFLRYELMAITGHQLDNSNFATAQQCQDWCVSLGWCRTIEYHHDESRKCQALNVTALDVGADYGNDHSADIYQRTCM